jgi:tRNA A-37 threonylcarbamoyl transferase component Bud32
MKNIEELINNVEKYKKTSVQQVFESRKNTVAYVILEDKPRLLKWFAPGFQRQMDTEHKILTKGSPTLNIPTICEKDEDNHILIMNYILGENLCDVINNEKTTISEKTRLMFLLAEWFQKYHIYFKKEDTFLIRGDSILRNFILTDRIWGVDFEESRKGKPIEDIASMCSSILNTDPMFTNDKFKLCELFIESYKKSAKWNLINIYEEISYALLERIQWRPNDEKLLREYSNKIRKQGLKI